MATPQLSPGVLVREVDLTVGRADNVLDNIGAIAGPFPIGPVDFPIDIATEQDLINTFGKPLSTDSQYEYWMSASSFLSYGGVLKVVRTSGSTLNNANAAVGLSSNTGLQIDNYDDYQSNHSTATNFTYAAKNPGSWANGLKVCFIDNYADQTIGIATTNPSSTLINATVGYGLTVGITSAVISGSGSTSLFNGYLKAIITGVNTEAVSGNSSLDVKIISRVSSAGTETSINYAEGSSIAAFSVGNDLVVTSPSGTNIGVVTATTISDWYDNQTLGLTNSTIYWKSIAPKPGTGRYVQDRNGKNDELHIVVVDDNGTITGNQSTLIEKHIGLSKAVDSISAVNSPQKTWYKDYLADFSTQIYAGANPSSEADAFWGTYPSPTGFSAGFYAVTLSDGLWGLEAQSTTYSAIGNVTYTLNGGVDYSSTGGNDLGGMKPTLGNLITSYELFSNKDEIQVDYLIMGPGFDLESDTQAKASYLISIAEQRKDCVATIGPHRLNLIGVTNSTTQTTNLITYFGSLPSSSYAIFDSGYKYTYDRFNNKFVYIPCNADVAGLMTRTNIVAYPWFSPAGQQRGILNNAIKLAYNPSKSQRDQLYPQRINSIVTQPGIGTLLFGDKTALGYASAFDRINVRRLFLTVEQALQRAAQAQLFELNDELTRANFKNIVEPYLRDIQAKRGLYGFLVVCDTTNNTPDVIDNNEFRADIYLKPTKSINYVTLTFVATRTGVSFEEVAGTV
jgi:hypothetical protein